jgi:hypothetical protein
MMTLNFKRRDNLVMATPSSVGFLAYAQIWRLGKRNSSHILIHNPLSSILFCISFFFFRIFLYRPLLLIHPMVFHFSLPLSSYPKTKTEPIKTEINNENL